MAQQQQNQQQPNDVSKRKQTKRTHEQHGMTNQSNSLVAQFFDRFPDPVSSFAAKIEPIPLPVSYQPSDYDVTSGRGRGCYNKYGNKQFRKIVTNHVDEYLSKNTKGDKTIVLEKIVRAVQEQGNCTARFVQYNQKTMRWYQLSPDQAREKVGHVIRSMTASRQCETIEESVSVSSSSLSLSSSYTGTATATATATTLCCQVKQASLLEQQASMFQDMLKTDQDNDISSEGSENKKARFKTDYNNDNK